MAKERQSREWGYPQAPIVRFSMEQRHITNLLINTKDGQKPEYAIQSQEFSMKKLPTVQPVRVSAWVEVLLAGRYIPVN
jgi:hypothetical protein